MSLWLPGARPQLCHRVFRISTRRPLSLQLLHASTTASVLVHRSSTTTRFVRYESTGNTVNAAAPQDPKPLPPAPKDDSPLATRAWKKVKHEAQHYWHGTQLLVSEVRISARLQWKILHGDSLTRRERRQVRGPLSLSSGLTNSSLSLIAEAHDAGLVETRSVRRVRHRAVHGIVAPRRTQTLPQHASVHFRGQVCCSELSSFLPSFYTTLHGWGVF